MSGQSDQGTPFGKGGEVVKRGFDRNWLHGQPHCVEIRQRSFELMRSALDRLFEIHLEPLGSDTGGSL